MALASSNISRRGLRSSAIARVPLLISPKEYQDLPKRTTLPLDVSWHMPNSNRSAVAEFLSGPRLPGAKRFDLDEVAELDIDKNPLSLTHMLPKPERFAEECRKLGIRNDEHVILYDTIGIFSSPRALYTFKAFGHENVSVLDGGLTRWIEEGYETENGDVKPTLRESQYKVPESWKKDWVRSYEQIVSNSELSTADPVSEVVLDHRPLPRFTGEAPEPRPGLSSGHIPNSLPLPFPNYLNAANDKIPYSSYKSIDELKKVFAAAVGGEEELTKLIVNQKGVVLSCGSGMTAAIGWLANELIKQNEGKGLRTSLYDESWTGYALRKESKIVKGKA
nr:thiosulfate/3-mercaptopyruvate sulfurtransferase [Kwoniella dejecticola CBS 10117]OBR84423.1 thiosulfate/3-mercaptopyruvate sulfurtransferase [Kwoniella dejecticola CBS 10117]